MKKLQQPRPQLAIFQPKPHTKFEDIDWLSVFERTDFKAIGLCQRHVQIDDTGRDWFGMPFLVDAECARYQGSPYVAPFTTMNEKHLNELLWKVEFLSQREQTPYAKASYSQFIRDYKAGQRMLTAVEHFEQRLTMMAEAGVYPTVEDACKRVPKTPEGFIDEDANGYPIRSEYEKFIQLDLAGKMIYALEHEIRWCRQSIYYDNLVAAEKADLLREAAERHAASQQYWAQQDAARLKLKQEYATKLLDANPTQPLLLPAAPQLDMFA
jgi:hypothetical protein